MFWHLVWHIFKGFYLYTLTFIDSDILSQHLFWDSIWHVFCNLTFDLTFYLTCGFWHSIWHCMWRWVWHLFRHFIWHISYIIIYMYILMFYMSSVYLTFFCRSILHFIRCCEEAVFITPMKRMVKAPCCRWALCVQWVLLKNHIFVAKLCEITNYAGEKHVFQ
jgi:hypothetical protein